MEIHLAATKIHELEEEIGFLNCYITQLKIEKGKLSSYIEEFEDDIKEIISLRESNEKLKHDLKVLNDKYSKVVNKELNDNPILNKQRVKIQDLEKEILELKSVRDALIYEKHGRNI